MLHLESPEIRRHLLRGKFGLEREALRVLGDGTMSHTPHPFGMSSHITRDFSENQTEVNTSAEPSAEGAVLALKAYGHQMQNILRALPEREYLWPFSNPPYLRGEEDIPIARFTGDLREKTVYREYLSGKYGRYKMTFSGIHVNYSFSEELLSREFLLRGDGRSRSFRDGFYLELAEKTSEFGWLLVILTAASPVLDASFFEQRDAGEAPVGQDLFTGMASVRCSEMGYWNTFTPVFDYTDIRSYVEGIRRYVEGGLLYSPSELYYPVRVKPKGENSLRGLETGGIDHIELRMFDVNPLSPAGLDVRDVRFTQLFLVWLASLPRREMTERCQVEAVQNYKNAAHYDLRTVRIGMRGLPGGEDSLPALEAALRIMGMIREFYLQMASEMPDWVFDVLEFENRKLTHPETRYAVRVRQAFSGTFLEKGMEHARRLQGEA